MANDKVQLTREQEGDVQAAMATMKLFQDSLNTPGSNPSEMNIAIAAKAIILKEDPLAWKVAGGRLDELEKAQSQASASEKNEHPPAPSAQKDALPDVKLTDSGTIGVRSPNSDYTPPQFHGVDLGGLVFGYEESPGHKNLVLTSYSVLKTHFSLGTDNQVTVRPNDDRAISGADMIQVRDTVSNWLHK